MQLRLSNCTARYCGGGPVAGRRTVGRLNCPAPPPLWAWPPPGPAPAPAPAANPAPAPSAAGAEAPPPASSRRCRLSAPAAQPCRGGFACRPPASAAHRLRPVPRHAPHCMRCSGSATCATHPRAPRLRPQHQQPLAPQLRHLPPAVCCSLLLPLLLPPALAASPWSSGRQRPR